MLMVMCEFHWTWSHNNISESGDGIGAIYSHSLDWMIRGGR